MRNNEYPLAVGSLIAYYRLPLLVALLLAACAACSPDGLYAVNAGTLSAGVLVRECTVAWGYYDSTSGKNDSGEWVLCR